MRHLELSSEWGGYCSDMQHPELTLKVNTLNIFYNRHEANSKNMLQKACVFKIFFFYCGMDSSVGLAVHFSFPLYNETLGTVRPLYRTGVSLLSRERFLCI